MLGNTRKRAYQSTVVILDVAIDLIAAHFMYHVVFPFVVIKVVSLRRNVSQTVFAIQIYALCQYCPYKVKQS